MRRIGILGRARHLPRVLRRAERTILLSWVLELRSRGVALIWALVRSEPGRTFCGDPHARLGVMRAGMTPTTRLPAACLNACWLMPGARAARACVDRPTCCTRLHHHAENFDHRDCAAADARHRAAIPATPATETTRPIVPGRLDGERLPQLRLHDGRQRPRRDGQLIPDGCKGIDSDLRTSAIASAASRAWSTFWAIRSK